MSSNISSNMKMYNAAPALDCRPRIYHIAIRNATWDLETQKYPRDMKMDWGAP